MEATRVLNLKTLRASQDETVAALLSEARTLEGRRAERTLTEQDARIFASAVLKYPMGRVRVYAQRGAFAKSGDKVRQMITILEYTPPDEHGPAQVVVSEGDARRPRGKGAWVEVNGQKEC
jgi:alkylated DNA nucleotide flippase Atl1